MRPPLAFACCLAFLLLPGRAAAGSAERAESLRGGQCLYINRVRGWTSLDDHRILVDGGRHKYRIEVAAGCSGLAFTHSVGLRGDPVSGRVCGAAGDAVITRDYPCDIKRMELLTNEQYKQAKSDYRAERKARKDAWKSKRS